MAIRSQNEIRNLISFRSRSDGAYEESHIHDAGISPRRMDLPAPSASLLEAFAHLSEQARRNDVTNQDFDNLAEHGQTLYDGENKGICNALKNFFRGMIPSYRRKRILNDASHEELKVLISNRKEENKLLTEPERLETGLTDKQTAPKTKALPRAKKPAKSEYEKLSKKFAILIQQATKETLPVKMKALSNYPLLSSHISKAIFELKNPLKAKANNQEAIQLIKEQVMLLEKLKKQVDISSAQLARRIESISKDKK